MLKLVFTQSKLATIEWFSSVAVGSVCRFSSHCRKGGQSLPLNNGGRLWEAQLTRYHLCTLTAMTAKKTNLYSYNASINSAQKIKVLLSIKLYTLVYGIMFILHVKLVSVHYSCCQCVCVYIVI